MNLTDITTATTAAKLAQLRGTGTYFVTEVGDTYIQATSFNGDEVVIEVCNEKFMQRTLPAGSDEELLRLGFTSPAKRNPNWWISIDGGQPELRRAADRHASAGRRVRHRPRRHRRRRRRCTERTGGARVPTDHRTARHHRPRRAG